MAILIPETECLVLVGHSVEQGNDGNWYPTRLLQTVEELGESPDGFRKFIRTGKKEPVTPEMTNTIVGGGIVVVAAAAEVYRQLEEIGKPPKVVLHSGGRPGYLDKAAADNLEMTEAKAMQPFFNKRMGRVVEPQVLAEKGLNTKDDIKDGLETALSFHCITATFMALEIRLPRLEAFYDLILSETERYNGITANFLPAEDIIGNIASRKNKLTQWKNVLKKFKRSEGYKRTLEAEKSGIKAMKAGSYGQGIGGIGKT